MNTSTFYRSTSTSEMQDLFNQNAEENLKQHMSKLTQTIPNADERKKVENEADQYRVLFERFLREKREIDWSKVKNVPDNVLLPYKQLNDTSKEDARALLDQLIVVKLNG